MKHYIFIILLSLLFAKNVNGQNCDSLAKSFIIDIFPNYFEKEVLVLSALDYFTRKEIIARIDKSNLKRKITFEDGKVKTEILNLSIFEINYIKFQLLDNNKNWLTKSFKNVTILNNVDTSLINKGKKINNFSKPIFLRNNTLCFFYSDYFCGGLCGSGHLSIFKKLNGKWELYWTLYSWDS